MGGPGGISALCQCCITYIHASRVGPSVGSIEMWGGTSPFDTAHSTYHASVHRPNATHVQLVAVPLQLIQRHGRHGAHGPVPPLGRLPTTRGRRPFRRRRRRLWLLPVPVCALVVVLLVLLLLLLLPRARLCLGRRGGPPSPAAAAARRPLLLLRRRLRRPPLLLLRGLLLLLLVPVGPAEEAHEGRHGGYRSRQGVLLRMMSDPASDAMRTLSSALDLDSDWAPDAPRAADPGPVWGCVAVCYRVSGRSIDGTWGRSNLAGAGKDHRLLQAACTTLLAQRISSSRFPTREY